MKNAPLDGQNIFADTLGRSQEVADTFGETSYLSGFHNPAPDSTIRALLATSVQGSG